MDEGSTSKTRGKGKRHNLMSDAARRKLPARREPYWHRVKPGKQLGYRAGADTWIAKVVLAGERRYEGLGQRGTFEEALKAAEAFFTHVDAGGSSERLTVAEVMQRYAAAIRGGTAGRNKGRLSDVQRGEKAREVERFITSWLGDLAGREIARLKHIEVMRWREDLSRDPSDPSRSRNPSSINRMMTTLRAALNWARENQLVSSDAAWVSALKSIESAGSRRERYVTPDERRTLLEFMRDDFKPYLRLLCLLPLRPGDPEDMLVQHYDARTHTLTVPSGKTASRRIPLSPDAEAVVREACEDKLPGAFMFMQRNGHRWRKEARRDVVQEARKEANEAAKQARKAGSKGAAGLGEDVVLYAIRGSVITDMITGGADPLTVARLSGTSLPMIQRHYGHLLDTRAREALSLVRL